jgi:hypothetical protein
MAAVLKARDLDLGRVVALKILPPESARDPENVTRFKQEARAAAKLDHENIARAYFCGEDQGLHFIAFEFVEGVTLRALIDRRGPLPAGECVRYMIQVAAGLAHAAERGVVHRDVKPSNILITPDGRAKIVDMGLARHLDAGSVNGGVTQSGVTLGTFDYISPEQALDPRRADVRSDIYSLGCAFYHALTCRPPVPEGTAAKKLQAHQSIDPLDPRELNPAIPDDLAAILARMMAKDPDRRYQTPAELIAHLKAVGDRLRVPLDAVASDSTVRAVPADARILPDPPRLRLGWVVAVAAVAVAAVVVAVSATGPGQGGVPWANRVAVATAPDTTPGPGGGSVSSPLTDLQADPDGFIPVTNAASLARVLTTTKDIPLRVKLASGSYDLTTIDLPVIQGREVEFSGPLGQMARVRIASSSGKRTDRSPGGLTLRAKSVTIHNVWFDIASPARSEDLNTTEIDAGLAILDSTRIDLRDCVFLSEPDARRAQSTAVSVAPVTGELVSVHLDRCLFGAGGVGLRLPARAELSVGDCGFGPLAEAIHVYSEKQPLDLDPPEMTPVRLDRSSFMLPPGSAVVGAAESLKPKVMAGYCVFAPAGGATDPKGPGDRHAVIVRVAGESSDDVRPHLMDGRKNAFYRVDPVATSARGGLPEEWKATEAPGWIELKQRPWAEPDPLAALADDHYHYPWKAFRLRVFDSPDPDLFIPGDDVTRVYGARFSANPRTDGSRVYKIWPPQNPSKDANVNPKVWVPEGTNLKSGEYSDLVKLLRDAQSGDTILIRHNGRLEVEQQVIQPPKPGNPASRGDFQLTFKPDKDYKPVLTPRMVNLRDLSLFRVLEGQVTFEGVQFLLKPGTDQDKLAAVTLVAGRGCTFRRCVFTLEESDDRLVAVVSLTDPDVEMKMNPAVGQRFPPKLTFENCLIRGRGRGVWVPMSRPFELDMKQCITAIGGPVVGVRAAGRDPGASAGSLVRFSQVTALIGGPLIELHGGKVGEMRASGLVPTTVTADACLFAAVHGAGQPIVEVEGTDLDPKDSNQVLKWVRGEPNRFANFDPLMPVAVVRPGGDGTPPPDWGWNTWIQFAGEVGYPVGKVTFVDEPAGLQELSSVNPGKLRVKKFDFPDSPDLKSGTATIGAEPDKVASPTAEEQPPE